MTGAAQISELRKRMEPIIGVSHEKFSRTAPPPPDQIRPVGGAYFDLIRRRRRALLTRPRTKTIEALNQYLPMLDAFASYAPFFDEYDLAEVALGTTAMGVKKVQHSDLDEGAPLRVTRDHELDPAILEHIVSMWRSQIRHDEDNKLTLPTQTNLGYPFAFSAQGALRPFTLGALALCVRTSKEKGLRLADVYSMMSATYGQPLLLQGSRHQHTGKVIPFIDGGGFTWSQRFEPRYRAIFMGSKVGIVWNRLSTKKLLKAAMRLPQHNQSRPFIQATIDKWKKDPTKQLIAVDVSKFDKGHGGKYLAAFAKQASRILSDATVEADFLAEVMLPLLVFYGYELFLTGDRIAPQLPSGVSFTTACGLFFGDYICQFIAKQAGLTPAQQGNTWDYLNWGDDMVFALPKHVPIDDLLKRVTTMLGLELTQEPVIRYLGFNYGNRTLSTNGGYSVARMAQKHFFPEREKHYPFSLIGYIARLTFIPKAEEFHRHTLERAWLKNLGEPFPYKDRFIRLQKALQDSLTAEDFDSDALQFLLHGLTPDDSRELLHIDGLDFDFSEWIGHHMTDFSDPLKTMREQDPNLFAEASVMIKQLALQGFVALPAFSNWLVGRWNLRQAGIVF